jgi:hypothetical protein
MTKADKRKTFARLATIRVNKAIHYIELLGNLRHYPYTEADIKKIKTAITEELDKTIERLENPKEDFKNLFTLAEKK